MGKPVTVDSDDLEAVLFTTAAIKSIEAVLSQRRDDVQVKQAAPQLAAAHDRIATAWRRATRVQQDPLWDVPLTQAEVILLARIRDEGPVWEGPLQSLRTVRQKGMVEVGDLVEVRRWGDIPHETTVLGVIARLTARGMDALAALPAPPKQEAQRPLTEKELIEMDRDALRDGPRSGLDGMPR